MQGSCYMRPTSNTMVFNLCVWPTELVEMVLCPSPTQGPS